MIKMTLKSNLNHSFTNDVIYALLVAEVQWLNYLPICGTLEIL